MTKFLPPPEIEAAAEAFLRKYHPSRTVPVPIEEILDLQLRLNIIPVPGLFNHSIDAFLSADLNSGDTIHNRNCTQHVSLLAARSQIR